MCWFFPPYPLTHLSALRARHHRCDPSERRAARRPDLEDSKRRLEEIRAERDRLQQQQRRLQGQVHDVNDELSNLERQRESTHRIVNEIERQIGGLASQLDRSSAELILAQDNLAERRAVLERRLVDIYKRGRSAHLSGAAGRGVDSAIC